ncbi:MAG: ABC transporter permease [Actinomycetaceae bacterium]|nr:ABC transporter permease [Actinomycetaceae bacterium]
MSTKTTTVRMPLWRFAWDAFYSLVSQPVVLMFSLGLPLIMFTMFGVNREYSDLPLAHGNIAGQLLVTFTAYGIVIGVSSASLNIARERQEGWLRHIALTPMGLTRYLVAKTIGIFAFGLVIMGVSYSLGALMGATMEAGAWLGSAVASSATVVLAVVMGLAVGALLETDAANGVLGGGTAILAFSSGMFIPLDQMGDFFRGLAPYMPMYGAYRVPIVFVTGVEKLETADVANLLAWIAIFATIVLLAARRQTSR